MRHTLKAVFDHRSDAQHVLDALLASGYPSTEMALSRSPPIRQANGGGVAAGGDDAASLGASVKHIFTRLFRAHHHQTMDHFSRFIRRGHVVTLTTGSELEAKSAVGIMERFGPVDIEDLHDEPDHASAGGPGVAADATELETQQLQSMSYQPCAPGAVPMGSARVARMSSDYPSGTALGALQYRALEASHYFGTQHAGSPPTGNTFQETRGASTRSDSMDDEGTQDARSSPGCGSHEDDMEAFRYGSEMRTTDKYRNCSWDEAEPGLHKTWEARTTCASTWDGSMSAIRRGWNSTSLDTEGDLYFRAHWNAIYRNSASKPAYDDRTPAYLYGSEARRSEKYRSHDWRDVEPEIEVDWKALHAGQLSSWETFKDAVKHGWNRGRLDMDGKDAVHEPQHASGDAGDGVGDDDRAAVNRHGSDNSERKSS